MNNLKMTDELAPMARRLLAILIFVFFYVLAVSLKFFRLRTPLNLEKK